MSSYSGQSPRRTSDASPSSPTRLHWPSRDLREHEAEGQVGVQIPFLSAPTTLGARTFGLVVGRAKFNIFGVRTEELIKDRPELAAVIRPLLAARKAIEEQIGDLDRKVLKLARHDMQVRSF